jgi:hypothetical protein
MLVVRPRQLIVWGRRVPKDPGFKVALADPPPTTDLNCGKLATSDRFKDRLLAQVEACRNLLRGKEPGDFGAHFSA